MVLHNPNNWHWVNKDTSAWARQYLEENLVGLETEKDGVSAKIDRVMSMDGDVDVSQRKGKVITLFDVKVQLEYSGKASDGTEASGTITIPEVAHDTEEDEYVFDIDIYSESSEKRPIKELVRTQLTPQLRKKLSTLGPAMMSEHGKDIQHAAGQNPSSSFTAPKYMQNSNSINKAGSGSTSSSGTATSISGEKVNVTTLSDTAEFRTSAEELYITFTDIQRVSAFTRSKPRVFKGDQVGGDFELFDGNVSGKIVSLNKPKQIVQTWRLKQWPAGHFSKLELNFDQNDVDHVTNLRVEWSGVPIGQEEVTLRNWQEYYVRSIKTTFGFGTVL